MSWVDRSLRAKARKRSRGARERRPGGACQLTAEPLEARRMLAIYGPELPPYDTIAGDWFASVSSGDNNSFSEVAEQSWIVRLNERATLAANSPAELQRLFDRQADVPIRVLRGLGLPGMAVIRSSAPAAAVEALLASRGEFAHFERDAEVQGAVAPNDELFGQLTGLDNPNQLPGGGPAPDISAVDAWNLVSPDSSSPVIVGVLDTGIDYHHPDLRDNIWTNPLEVPGDGIDNDGSDKPDDTRGWDFVNNDNDPFDDNGHGTHVAGVLGATGNNQVGIAGVTWRTSAQILPLKVLGDDNRGEMANVIRAITYATTLRQLDHPIRVLNASLGNYTPSIGLRTAIQAAGEAGIMVVAAAGNGVDGLNGVDTDFAPFYPAALDLDNIVSVAAVDNLDRLARSSNYGAQSVDLAAPGVGVLSTIPGDCGAAGCYATRNGTSVAAPHVSGVAAMLWSDFPLASVAEVRDALLRGVDRVEGLHEHSVTGGRLNALGSLELDTIAPRVTQLNAPDVVQEGGTRHLLPVRFADNNDVSVDSLLHAKLIVTRNNAARDTYDAGFYSVDNATNGPIREVTFAMDAPGGFWDTADYGNYEITLPAQQVRDVAGNYAAAESLGGFSVRFVEAGKFRVDSLADNPDVTPGDGRALDSTGRTTLRAAIQEANALPGPITIFLPDLLPTEASTYRLILSGPTGGDLDVTGDITIIGEGFANTMIDGDRRDRVFDVHPGARLELRQLAVQRGRTAGDGGGIRNQGQLILDGVAVLDNDAARGAGVWNGPSATADISRTSLVENRATSDGGGVYNAAELTGPRPEFRLLEAASAEFRVNATANSTQQSPAVAMDAAGNTLVVWEGYQAADSGRIYARRFDRQGNSLGGGEFQVNLTTGQRIRPSVAMDDAGDALVAWQGYAADGLGWGVHVRRLDAGGAFQGSEFTPYALSSNATGHQVAPSVAMHPAGAFSAIAWSGAGDGDTAGVYARLYDSAGAPVGPELRVPTSATDREFDALAAVSRITSRTEALVVWTAERADGSYAILGQRLSAAGQRLGNAALIAEASTGSLSATSVVATAAGYAVAWTLLSADGTTEAVYLRRLDADASPVGLAAAISQSPSQVEHAAKLAALPDGGLVATYASLGRDGQGWDVYARQFDDGGAPRSPEFRVNTTTFGGQAQPSVASDSAGRVVITWSGNGPDDGAGVFARRYEAAFDADSVSAAASMRLTNVTFSLNTSATGGAAVHNAPNVVTMLEHVTAAFNTTSGADGAALVGGSRGLLALHGSQIVGNSSSGARADLAGEIVSLGYNLVSLDSGRNGYGRASDLVSPSAESQLEPLPADGTELVHGLRGGSTAIDAGDAARYPAADQLGLSRPQDGNGDGVARPDIGAVERYYVELRGVRYQDSNGNGLRDAGEPGLAGLVVYLDENRNGRRDERERTAVTDSVGGYEFKRVAPGEHAIGIERQRGWRVNEPQRFVPADTGSLSAPMRPVDQAAVHIDRDGDLDLVVLESNSAAEFDRLAIYSNDGEGRFAAPRYVSTGVPFASPTLAYGDVDGDGDLDFVVANAAASGHLSLLINDGGVFAAPRTLFPGANAPSAPLLADFNGDEIADLAWLQPVAEDGTAVLRVAINDGTGQFPAAISYAVSGLADAIVAGDINLNDPEDDDLDLVVGRDVLRNQGGTFTRESIGIDNPVTPRILADVDGRDGPDVVGIQRAARQFGVLSNNGAGVFTKKPAVDLPGEPRDVALADFDGDGDLDAAVALYDAASIVVLDNDGRGKFTINNQASLDLAGQQPLSVATADFDGHGLADLSTTLEAPDQLKWYFNANTQHKVNVFGGESREGLDFAEQALSGELSGIVFHDLNRDGLFQSGAEPPLERWEIYLDLNENGQRDAGEPITPLTDATGRYAFPALPPGRYVVREQPREDWEQTSPREQDGYQYEVTLGPEETKANLHFGNFDGAAIGQSQGQISGRVFADTNGNGRYDAGELGLPGMTVFIDTNNSGRHEDAEPIESTDDQGVYTIEQLGPSDYAVRVQIDDDAFVLTDPLGNDFAVIETKVGEAPQALGLVDFNNDGWLDVAVPNGITDNITLLRNNGHGVFQSLGVLAAGVGASSPSSIAVADLNRDGRPDLAVTNLSTSNVSIFLSDGIDWFVPGGRFEAGPDPTAVTAGDWDRDDDIDLAVVNEHDDRVWILQNNGAGAFTTIAKVGAGDAPRSIAAGDIDGDGDLDLVVGNFDSHNVTVMRNVGGAFGAQGSVTHHAAGKGVASVALADLDGAAGLDIVTANYFGNNASLLRNLDAGGFGAPVQLKVGAAPTSIAASDIDRDGDLDLLATTLGNASMQRGASILRSRLRQDGQLGFEAVETVNIGAAEFPVSRHLTIAVADLTGDGKPDPVITDGVADRVRLLQNAIVNGAHHVELTGLSSQQVPAQNFGLRSRLTPPTIDAIDDQFLNEDDPRTQLITLTGISDGGDNTQELSVTAAGNVAGFFDDLRIEEPTPGDYRLRYHLAANRWGVASVTVTVAHGGFDRDLGTPGDNGVTAVTFDVHVAEVNDPPSFTLGGNLVRIDEDAGAVVQTNWVGNFSYGPFDPDQPPLEFLVQVTNPGLFSVPPRIVLAGDGGRLEFTTAPNAFGQSTVSLALRDGAGGNDTSAAQQFLIRVVAVNDPPTFVVGTNVTVLEDAATTTIANWLTGISPGAENERANQTVSFEVSPTDSTLFAEQPSVDANGTLRFRPALNANGVAQLSVVARDSAEGVSAAQPFTITIVPLNDAPSFTAGPDITVPGDGQQQVYPGWATGIRVGPDNESQQSWYFQLNNNNNDLFDDVAGQPTITPDGTLVFKPRVGSQGTAIVTVVLYDSGGFQRPGDVFYDVESFVINVVAGLAGDTNGDGRVDVVDLNNIRNNFGAQGQGGAPAPGEAYPFDGVVDVKDLNAVRNNFGASLGSPSAPLPSAGAAMERRAVFNERGVDAVFQLMGEDQAMWRPRRAGRYPRLPR